MTRSLKAASPGETARIAPAGRLPLGVTSAPPRLAATDPSPLGTGTPNPHEIPGTVGTTVRSGTVPKARMHARPATVVRPMPHGTPSARPAANPARTGSRTDSRTIRAVPPGPAADPSPPTTTIERLTVVAPTHAAARLRGPIRAELTARPKATTPLACAAIPCRPHAPPTRAARHRTCAAWPTADWPSRCRRRLTKIDCPAPARSACRTANACPSA